MGSHFISTAAEQVKNYEADESKQLNDAVTGAVRNLWSPVFFCFYLNAIDGETVETVSDFIFLGSKITAVGDCSHEVKRRLLLRRKAMTNLDNVLKKQDVTLPTKVRLVKAVVFPVVMYECESQNI